MDRECMNVVYASNDGYARHLGTSLYSLLDRNRDFAEISVYVLTLGLSEENQGKLREIAEHFGRRLIFLNLDDLLERIGYEVDTGGFDISVMLRLFMGDMLPESVERVLYLDCDTVVLQSLKHLWKEELEGKRAYMLGYHMLDYATAICPPVRRLVSRKLGMKLVESRKKA